MAVLTTDQLREMWRKAFRENKPTLKADGLPPGGVIEGAGPLFQAVEDWYAGLPPPQRQQVREVAKNPVSAERQELRDLRAALNDLRAARESVLAQFTDPVEQLRTDVRARITTLQGIVDGEARPPTKAQLWSNRKAAIMSAIDAAAGRAVGEPAAQAYTLTWLEVRHG